jgi:hypothetical protein
MVLRYTMTFQTAKTHMVNTDEALLNSEDAQTEEEETGLEGVMSDDSGQERPKLPEADTFQPGKPMGRPKGTPTLSPPANPDALRFPRPQYKLYKSDHVNQHQKASHFFKYWNGLSAWAQNRSIIYVYRDHPVMLEPPKDLETGKPAWYKYIDKIAGNAPLNDALDILRRYGAGDYHLTFNDSVPKRKGGEDTLCQFFVTGLGGGDFTSSPPTDDLINDVAKVDLDHPANKSYVAYLRGKGMLPGQVNSQQTQEGETMASTVVEQVLEQNKGLIAQVMEKNNKEDKSSGVDSALIGMMVDGAKKSNEMVKESFTESMNVLKEAAKAAAPAPGAVQGQAITLADVLTLVKELKGNDSGMHTEVMALRTQLADAQEKHMDRLVSLFEKSQQPQTPFTPMKEGMEALKMLNGTLDEIRGVRGGDDNSPAETIVEAAADMGPKWLKTAAPLIQGVITIGSQVLSAWLMSRQQPQPMPQQYGQPYAQPYQQPYYPQPAQPQGPAQLPIQIGGPASQTAPVQPPQPQMQPQPMQPQPQPMQPQPMQPLPGDPNMIAPQVRMLIDNILPALASHLTLDHDGTDFADWFILNLGEVTYNQVKGFGAGELLKALSVYPPSQQVLSGFPPEKVQSLIAEFCEPKFEGDEDEREKARKITDPTPAA